MTAHARTHDPRTSKLAAARINAAQAAETDKITPTEAVTNCVASLRNFSEREIRLQMKLRYPGSNEDTGTICSFERIRGVLSDMKKAGTIEPLPLEEGATHHRFRWVPPVLEAATKQTSLFGDE